LVRFSLDPGFSFALWFRFSLFSFLRASLISLSLDHQKDNSPTLCRHHGPFSQALYALAALGAVELRFSFFLPLLGVLFIFRPQWTISIVSAHLGAALFSLFGHFAFLPCYHYFLSVPRVNTIPF